MDEGGSVAKKILGGVMTIIERYNGVSVKNLFSNTPSFLVQLYCYNDEGSRECKLSLAQGVAPACLFTPINLSIQTKYFCSEARILW